MEKSTKSEKDISFVLDTRTVNKEKKHYYLKANEEQKTALQTLFNVPKIEKLTFEFDVFLNKDLIEINGNLTAKIRQICVVTTEEFQNELNEKIRLYFTEDEALYNSLLKKEDFSPEEEDVDLIQNGRIYFYDLIQEQFGLALDPFPKKTDDIFTYYELKADDVKENPFSVLKHLTK